MKHEKPSPSALIGHTGFVGGNLAARREFDRLLNSQNIEEIRGKKLGRVVCAGVQAKKWWANLHPEEDWRGIQKLLDVLETITAEEFILISTVDVYANPKCVDERAPGGGPGHGAYGRHRLAVEEFVRGRFPGALILRLPGLFGKGIKKNVIHDLLKNHETEKINPDGVFQYYPLSLLADDMEFALRKGLRILNLATQPVSTREIAGRFFPGAKLGEPGGTRPEYDMRSAYDKLWGGGGGYLYSKESILRHLGEFLEEERAA